MQKFIDILDECCKDGGECNCKKGKKCDNPSCKCKDKKCPKCGLDKATSATDFMGKGRNSKKCACNESEAHKEEEEGYEAGFDGLKKSTCPYPKGDWKYKAWMEGFENAKEDKSTEFGKGIKESKFEKYLQEQQLDENVEVADLLGDKFKTFQASIVQELGKGFPKSIPKSSIQSLIKDAQGKGLDKLVKQLTFLLDK